MAVTIKAKKVRPGHSIPGLDNAYVINVEKNTDTYVTLTFEVGWAEGYLTVHRNHPITVDQIDT